MRRCSVKPYDGNEDYIFVSYSHRDKSSVFPIIERLTADGYRVWYDEGIHPGSEWPEVVADYLNHCSLCLAIISENSLNSHNCRREINFTLYKKKPIISVFIESVSMSPGMQLQLSTAQSIFKYQLSTEEFFEKLYSSKFLESTRGEPRPDVVISKEEDYFADDTDDLSEDAPDQDKEWFSDKDAGEPEDQKKSSEKKKFPVALAVLAAVIVFAVGAAAFFLIAHNANQQDVEETQSVNDAAETAPETVLPVTQAQSEAEEFDYEQKLVVTAAENSSDATAELYEYRDGDWKSITRYTAKVAENGIGEATEGSKTTPEGIFKLGYVLCATEVDTDMPTKVLTSSTCVVDDVNSIYYNQIMDSNALPSDVRSYDPIGRRLTDGSTTAIIFIENNGNGYSIENVEREKTSAIGLRGITGELTATVGDVDISDDDLSDLLNRLDPELNPVIEIKSE